MSKKTEQAVIRAAMRWYRKLWPEILEFTHGHSAEVSLARACHAHAKTLKKGRK